MDLAKADEGNRMGSSSKLVERIKRARRSTPELFPQTARVACQGVEGAYSQVAADRLFKHPDISYVRTFADVFEAVETGAASMVLYQSKTLRQVQLTRYMTCLPAINAILCEHFASRLTTVCWQNQVLS